MVEVVEILHQRIHKLNITLIVLFTIVYILSKTKLTLYEILLIIILFLTPLVYIILLRVIEYGEKE